MPNQLVLHIQPEEGISLRFAAKVPGPAMRLGAVNMNFEYSDYFGAKPSTGYERPAARLHDRRRHTFPARGHGRSRMVCGQPGTRRLEGFAAAQFPQLPAGTWGPKEAEDLLERDGRHWRNFEK